MSLPPPRSEDCMSDLQLDRLRVGELVGSSAERVHAHLTVCPACEHRYAALQADAERFAESAPSFDALRAHPTARQSPPLPGAARGALRPARWAVVTALAAAAGSLLFVGPGAWQGPQGEPSPAASPSDSSNGSSSEVRTKGSLASFDFVVRRDQNTVIGTPGMVLRPGDRLRFTVSSRRPVFVGIWGIDSSGLVSDYATAPELLRVPPGHQVALPQTIELDASLGQERLVAVFCQDPQPVEAIRSALSDASDEPSLPLNCEPETVSLRKALR